MFNFLQNIGSTELIILLLILILLFGAKVAVKLGKTSGETVKEIKKIKRTFTESLEDDDSEPGKN